MKNTRRDFLKAAGLCSLGLFSKPVKDAFAQDESAYSRRPEALVGKRWGMAVDVKKCAEKVEKDQCKDCIAACHVAHNVPTNIEGPKEEIKWIWRTTYEHAFPGLDAKYTHLEDLPFVVLCNHCDNPPCVRVCPTKATFVAKDGIVMMDFHRCIGCRYCMAACPFGSRSFNFKDPRPFIPEIRTEFPTRMRGVVEKCNFCAERLAEGLLPACVDACKAKALIFGDLADPDSEVRQVIRENYTIRRKVYLGTQPSVFYVI